MDSNSRHNINTNSIKNNRIYFLDEIRGIAVFCMVFYHLFFTMAFLFDFEIGVNLFCFFTPAEPIFAGIFILISGISSRLSRSNILRGIKLLIIAMCITIFTYIFIPKGLIIFGILHMLSVCMILFGVFERLLNKIPIILGIVLSIILFFVNAEIEKGYIGISGLVTFYIPKSLYNYDCLFPIGIYNNKFNSMDYFSLLPWGFLFLFGTFIGKFYVDDSFPDFMYKKRSKAFSYIGKNSLIIYILHQPVIYGILYAVKLIFKI